MNKLTIEGAIAYKKLIEENQDIHWSSAADVLSQLADTLRENERLLKTVCDIIYMNEHSPTFRLPADCGFEIRYKDSEHG